MKLPILIVVAGMMGVAHAQNKRTVVADTERGGSRQISWQPEIDDEDIDESSLVKEDEGQSELDVAEWLSSLGNERPDLFTQDVGDEKVVVDVNKSTQRGKIIIGGKEVETFKLSTGKAGTPTRSGTFHPGAKKVNWLSGYASKKYKRPIYLKHAVQIDGGNFMHAASTGAMSWLGQRRSAGCVRVPPRIAKKVYGLAENYGRSMVFKVH